MNKRRRILEFIDIGIHRSSSAKINRVKFFHRYLKYAQQPSSKNV